ncbi:MAG: exodeoxyribonuclease VII small subunit [Candidatus Paracaedibacteraceae bacterium]|nr:exodeoxyribonuclease VII small subunit [Candidatus Paracaedibacteraceae bacterium]
MQETIANMTFEQALQELEVLVRRLEEGRLPLEEAISSYEKGVALKSHCQAKLQAAKLKVDQIMLNPNGDVELKSFDGEDA